MDRYVDTLGFQMRKHWSYINLFYVKNLTGEI
jgi:hypothetical protein